MLISTEKSHDLDVKFVSGEYNSCQQRLFCEAGEASSFWGGLAVLLVWRFGHLENQSEGDQGKVGQK